MPTLTQLPFQWMNQSDIDIQGDHVSMTAPPKSDFFCDPRGLISNDNAPYYYTEVIGDFVFRARVRPQFLATYDSCTLMVMDGPTTWAKVCFEFTDFGTHAVVSVVTNGVSDDANGPNISEDTVWLQVARRDNLFAFHYSLDGQRYDMVRIFCLPVSSPIKVGLVAQSPTGEGAVMEFSDVSLEARTVGDLRAGK